MARKIPRDSLPAEWATNPHIVHHGTWSCIADGWWHAPLKLALAQNRRACLALNQIYAGPKYAAAFTSATFLEQFERPAQTLADGILHTGDAGHWHYLVDGLGNLTPELFEHYGRVYVDAAYTDDQIAFLAACIGTLTVRPVEIVRIPPATCAVSNVAVPVNRSREAKIAHVRHCVARLVPEVDAASPTLLYVTRRRAATRRLANEDALVAQLAAQYGVERLDNESLTLAEQVRRYRGARVIIGPHGAGLTNLLLARSPQLLVELFHTYHQPFYEELARAAGAAYLAVSGTPLDAADTTGRLDNRDFTVDGDELLGALAPLLRMP